MAIFQKVNIFLITLGLVGRSGQMGNADRKEGQSKAEGYQKDYQT